MSVEQSGRERGFTLLEVLVAFVIAGLALTALYRGALDGLLSTRISGQTEEALSRARSRLTAVGHNGPLIPGEQAGDDGGGYRWRLRIAPAAQAPASRGNGAEVARGPSAALYAVTVWVSFGAREVRLDSARVGTAPMSAAP